MENRRDSQHHEPQSKSHPSEPDESVKRVSDLARGLVWHLKHNVRASTLPKSTLELVSETIVKALLNDSRLLYDLVFEAGECVSCSWCFDVLKPGDDPWCERCHNKAAARKAAGERECSGCGEQILPDDAVWCDGCRGDASAQNGEVQ